MWLMGNPKPGTVSGVARVDLGHKEGAFSVWRSETRIPDRFDVEKFAVAFVRFDNGATMILEVSWLLHHNTMGEDMQTWLYGTEAGCHWPKGEFLATNYKTQQLYDRVIKLTIDSMEPHALECIEFSELLMTVHLRPYQLSNLCR